MKKLKAIAIGALLTICLQSQAQKIPLNEPDYNKAKLFNDLPGKMNLKVSEMETLFSFSPGSSIRIQATENFLFEGVIISRSDAGDTSVRTVVIRSTNRPGASFTFTRITNADGSIAYRGRIISRNNGDAFEIIQEKGLYVLQKKNLYDLISE